MSEDTKLDDVKQQLEEVSLTSLSSFIELKFYIFQHFLRKPKYMIITNQIAKFERELSSFQLLSKAQTNVYKVIDVQYLED